MWKQFNTPDQMVALPPKPATHPIRLILAILGGLVLLVLSQLFIIELKSSHAAPSPQCALGGDTPCGADLGLEKMVSNTTPAKGQTITYILTVTNYGPQDATWVTVSDTLPISVTYITHTSSQKYSPESGEWKIKKLLVDESIILTITAEVTACSTPDKPTINKATILTVEPSDPDESNNEAEVAIIACANLADLAIIKSVNNDTPVEGELITYTITITNFGPNDATGIHLTETYPSRLNFGIPPVPPNVISAGTAISLTITATVEISAVGQTMPNTVTVSADQPDSDTTNNTAAATIHVPGADLKISKTVDKKEPQVDEMVTYTIMVTNRGPDEATDIEILDKVPWSLTYQSYQMVGKPDNGSYEDGDGKGTIKKLAQNESAVLNIYATMNRCAMTPTVTNTARIINVSPTDPVTNSNNEASALITVTYPVTCYVYLPVIFKSPPVCYFDNFSNPNSGWPKEDDNYAKVDYSTTGEYFIQRKVSGLRIESAPFTPPDPHYILEVDTRWDNIEMGYEYGLVFGQTSFPVPAYLFGIGPDPSDPSQKKYRYRLFRVLSFNEITGQVVKDCVTKPCWKTISPTIKISSTNHLKMECNKDKISLYVNDELLWDKNAPYPCIGVVGVFAQSSPTNPDALAFFDNFRTSCPLPSAKVKTFDNQSYTIMVSTSIEFNWIE